MGKRVRNTMLRFALPVLAATIAWAMAAVPCSLAGDLEPIPLPPPQTDGGKPLMQALALRATSRAFAPDPIPAQTLSNLLWAAWGINRPADGKRTAPSARNWQEIDLLVVRADGTFLYDAAANRLVPVAAGDHRALTGVQPFVKDAPLTLLMVADTSRMKGAEKDPEQRQWLWADAGFISQNIYLFCASEGLATGVRALVDRPALAKALGLKENQLVLLAQCVGRPAPPPGSRKHGSAPPSLQDTRDEGACNGVRLQIYRGNHTAGARPRWDLHGLPPCAPVTSVRSRKIDFPSVIISGSSLSYTRNKQCPRGNGSDLDSPERQEAT